MAKPTVTISLLTPISIRLSWTGGNGDYEVWWKSDHPAGQEYIPLASVTGTTYDVGSLSWTTTYYFKVKNFAGEWSDEINVFICCGQAVILGPGVPVGGGGPTAVTTLAYWQQSADQDDGVVGFTVKLLTDRASFFYYYQDGVWYYLGTHSFRTQFQAGTRKVGTKIAALEMYSYWGSENGWYILTLWDGYTLRTAELPPQGRGGDFYPSFRTAQFAITMNEDGRIVVAPSYIDWSREDGPGDINQGGSDVWPCVFSYLISNDWGNSWSSETIIAESISREQGMTIAEDGNKDVWLARTDYDPLLNPAWYNEMGEGGVRVSIIYYIYKWGTPRKTITTALQNEYGPPPYYPTVNPKTYAANCNIATEGNKIAVCYTYDHTLIAKVGNDYWGTPRYFVDTSDDNGATWNGPQEILFSDSLLAASQWRTTLAPICISNGNLFVYVVGGTYLAKKYYILKSTDNGATWSIAYDIPVTVAKYYWDAEIRANGNHITMAGCGMSMSADSLLGFAESLDGGLTWHPVNISLTTLAQIVAPA